MPSDTKLVIQLFTTPEGGSHVTLAIPDDSLSVSTITKSEVKKTSLKFTKVSAHEKAFVNSAIGTITFDCTVMKVGVTRSQLFYVVKKARAPVVLGNASPLYRDWMRHIPSVRIFIVEENETEGMATRKWEPTK
ncbi:hypothetical protein GP486_000301 [Trichoglossum hirsutum]|uniref:Uncharacterized protein n=1 Tax=Trichoglossum hirsutum TaxID=265104 RepID=A0A9P8LIU6_9PEZI|nr:hypothetical protein GP486_000301 [Trichoglossum hirsutum]